MTRREISSDAPVRRWLFFGAGLALPLAAFPVLRVAGKHADLTTVLAVLFVLSSGLVLLKDRARLPLRWLALASGLPLLALLWPAPPFSRFQFAFSYVHWLLMLLVFASAWLLPCREETLRKFLLAQAAVGALVAAFALYEVAGLPRGWPLTGSVISSWQSEPFRMGREGPLVRPTSLFLEPAWLGAYLAWVFVSSLTAALSLLERGGRRILAVVSTILAAAALASTVSWGAYADGATALCGVAGAAAWTFDRGARRRFLAAFVGLAVAAILLVGVVAGGRVSQAVQTRIGRLSRTPLSGDSAPGVAIDSTRERLDNATDAIFLFRSHPVVGIGLGQFSRFEMSVLGRSRDIANPWSGWFAIAAETGFLGPVVLLGALVFPLLSGLWSGDRFSRLFAPAAVALLFVQQIHLAAYISLSWWFPAAFLALVTQLGSLTTDHGHSSLPRFDRDQLTGGDENVGQVAGA
jgi:hypothetical protein